MQVDSSKLMHYGTKVMEKGHAAKSALSRFFGKIKQLKFKHWIIIIVILAVIGAGASLWGLAIFVFLGFLFAMRSAPTVIGAVAGSHTEH